MTPTSSLQPKSARSVLLEIRRILSDSSLTDSECIERICRVYETLPDMPEADRRIPKRTAVHSADKTISEI